MSWKVNISVINLFAIFFLNNCELRYCTSFKAIYLRILQYHEKVSLNTCLTLRKKCPYSELFWSAFFPHFPAFGLNTERYGVIGSISPYSVRTRENAGKMRTRITPNTDSLYAVLVSLAFLVNFNIRLISMLHSK